MYLVKYAKTLISWEQFKLFDNLHVGIDFVDGVYW